MSATERPSGLRGFEIRFQCVEPGLSVGRNLAASVDKKRPKAGREGPPEGHRAGPYGNRRARSPRALRGNRRSAIPGDLTFACHETTRQPVVQHCAGALILNEKLGRPNWRIRFAATLGLFDPSRLHLEAPVVDSFEAFVRMPREARDTEGIGEPGGAIPFDRVKKSAHAGFAAGAGGSCISAIDTRSTEACGPVGVELT